jgi:hypothetical protein
VGWQQPSRVRTGPGRLRDLAADDGLRISAYTAEPGTPSDDALKLLATWAATPIRSGTVGVSRCSPGSDHGPVRDESFRSFERERGIHPAAS